MLSKPLKGLALALSLAATTTNALDLDPSSPDSVRFAASKLAASIASLYTTNLNSSGIPGLLPDPFYWFQGGNIFQSLLHYAHLTGDDQYNDIVAEGMKFQIGDRDAFMPPNQTKVLGNEDQATWALAALSAAELNLKDPVEGLSWLQLAANVFDTQAERWGVKDACKEGGLRWQIFTFNNGYEYMDSRTNSLFFLLAARLAKQTGNATFSEWADKSFEWNKEVGLIEEDWTVNDGADARTKCDTMNHIQWTSPSAMFLEGAAVMWNITNGTNKEWESAVKGLSSHFSKVFLTKSSPEDNSEKPASIADSPSTSEIDPAVLPNALYEVACESIAPSNNTDRCNIDQKSFKAHAVRSLHRAALSAPIIGETFNETLVLAAEQAAKVCSDEKEGGLECGFRWTGKDNGEWNGGSLMELNNALEAVQGLLWADKGVGKAEGRLGGNGTDGGAGQNGSPTQSGGAPESTGAAGRVGVAWGFVAAAAMMAVAGLA